jgi:hypothetical protein
MAHISLHIILILQISLLAQCRLYCFQHTPELSLYNEIEEATFSTLRFAKNNVLTVVNRTAAVHSF